MLSRDSGHEIIEVRPDFGGNGRSARTLEREDSRSYPWDFFQLKLEIDSKYRRLLDAMYDGVYLLDLNRVITFWNRAAERLTGYTAGEVIGRKCSDNILVHVDGRGNNLCYDRCPVSGTIQDQQPREELVYFQHKQGHRVPVIVRTSPLYGDNGDIVGVVESFTESELFQRLQQERDGLERESLIDELTQLPNRRFVERKLDLALEEYRRYQECFGILVIDADNFKAINDTYGHAFGDTVLKIISQTLANNSRVTDFLGRWGGEEFVYLCRRVVSLKQVCEIGERLRSLVDASVATESSGQPVEFTVSIGCSLVRPNDSSESIFKRADELLFKAKQQGRNRTLC